MKVAIATIFLALSLVGCNQQTVAQRDALEQGKPGYLVAKRYCSQCHAMPYGSQHPPVSWPYVVSRMEDHMEFDHKPMPSTAERDEIIAYFQKH